jgi:curved DNA-binding protein
MKYIDYYKALGLDRSATPQDISRAFKKLARKYHPDLNKSPDAEKRFKEITEANDVLKDPETRRRYDALGADWKHGAPFEAPPSRNPGNNIHFESAEDFSDFFAAFTGRGQGRRRASQDLDIEDLFGLGGGAADNRRPSRGLDVESELTVELEDVLHGPTKTIQLSGPSGTRRYDVKIPRGIHSGEKIRLGGQGMSSGNGAPGDLYITIRVAPHPLYKVEADDLVVDVPISAWDAALGVKAKVRTLDGEVTMTLPPGVSSGQRLRLKGKGLPRRGGVAGDLYAQITIVVPKALTREQERLFTKLKEVSPVLAA